MDFYNIGSSSFRHPDWINVDHWSEWYSKSQGDSIQIDWDLLTLSPLPVESNTATVVYSSHTIEHVTDAAVQNMFNESYRILKEDGVLRIVAPNIDILYGWYKKGIRYKGVDYKHPTTSKIKLSQATIEQLLLWWIASSASEIHRDGSDDRISDEDFVAAFDTLKYEEALDWCVSKCSIEKQRKYPGNHISWWNEAKVIQTLRVSGFENIYVSSFGESKAQAIHDTNLESKSDPGSRYFQTISLYVEAIK